MTNSIHCTFCHFFIHDLSQTPVFYFLPWRVNNNHSWKLWFKMTDAHISLLFKLAHLSPVSIKRSNRKTSKWCLEVAMTGTMVMVLAIDNDCWWSKIAQRWLTTLYKNSFYFTMVTGQKVGIHNIMAFSTLTFEKLTDRWS